jgi:hypothetical protein
MKNAYDIKNVVSICNGDEGLYKRFVPKILTALESVVEV